MIPWTVPEPVFGPQVVTLPTMVAVDSTRILYFVGSSPPHVIGSGGWTTDAFALPWMMPPASRWIERSVLFGSYPPDHTSPSTVVPFMRWIHPVAAVTLP